MAYIKVILAKTNIKAKKNKKEKNKKQMKSRKLFIPLHCQQHVLSICHATNPSIQSGPGKLSLNTFYPSVFLSK